MTKIDAFLLNLLSGALFAPLLVLLYASAATNYHIAHRQGWSAVILFGIGLWTARLAADARRSE